MANNNENRNESSSVVDVGFHEDVDAEEMTNLEEWIHNGNVFDRGIAHHRLFNWDGDTNSLEIYYNQLKRVILEHQWYEDAEGFTSNHVLVLRAIEMGPDRMRPSEIRTKVNEQREENGLDVMADSTIDGYRRDLQDFGLVEQLGSGPNTNYNYIGP